MDKATFSDVVEAQINSAAKQIVDKTNIELDHLANGKLGYLLSVRRILDGKATKEDLGLHDAINDVLQQLGIVEAKKTYLANIK
ncbi:TPA: hypothetical protein ACG3DQ_005449 [Pseudomonas putida]